MLGSCAAESRGILVLLVATLLFHVFLAPVGLEGSFMNFVDESGSLEHVR